MMRTLCPNLDREDALETVLEVPIPEEMFTHNNNNKSWQWHNNMKSWIRGPQSAQKSPTLIFGDRNTEIQLLLGVVGAPLVPLPIHSHHSFNKSFKDHPIETSMAKYIVQQYIAAAGGENALNSIHSMCAVGKFKMATTEVVAGEGLNLNFNNNNNNKVMKIKSGAGEIGGFVLWQKRPDLWSLELMVSGCKISAGSNGKVAWRQTPWHHSHASRGPPRPLRRSLQGLDPRSTANLFSNAICTGEKTVNNEDCFVLKLEAESSTLKARSSNNVEIMKHTIWGYFSQRTGLLVHLEDSHLLRINASPGNDVFWETTMDSVIKDYRTIEGVNIAHAGRTSVSLFRFGENSKSNGHTRTRMEEVWEIEEVDFNVKGLSGDCFLPPADLIKEEEEEEEEECGGGGIVTRNNKNSSVTRNSNSKSPFRVRPNSAKIVAIDEDDSEIVN